MLNPGSEIDVDIEKPAAGGRMLARHERQVVLVLGAIPGERVRARIERVGKGLAFAEVVEVLTASPDRRPADDWKCGGNVLAHVSYPRQLEIKGDIVRDAFGRIGRLPIERPGVVASPEAGYRMRARLHAHAGRLGFYREATHQLCDPAQTGQLLPETSAWVLQTQRTLETTLADVADALTGIEIAENIAGDQRACHLELRRGADAARFAILADGLTGLSAQREQGDVERLAGTPAIVDTVQAGAAAPPVTFRRDVRAFFQGNRYLVGRLAEHVVARVPRGPVIDLYAGVGLFGLSAAAAGFAPVRLVEGDPISGQDMASNAAAFPGVSIEQRSVERFLERRRGLEAARDATVIVDPPRTGMSKAALVSLAQAAPSRILYVSCDAATLARDTRVLLDSSYGLDEVTGFDMFPNTAHVEVVAVFVR